MGTESYSNFKNLIKSECEAEVIDEEYAEGMLNEIGDDLDDLASVV